MKRKKRNPKIIEMSLFNIRRKSKPEIDPGLLKKIKETNEKNREEIEKRQYTREGAKRLEELKRQKEAEVRQKQLEEQQKESSSPPEPKYNPANKLAEQARRAKLKQRLDSNVTSTSRYDPYKSSKLERIKSNQKTNMSSYLSNKELLQRVYLMFGLSYDNSYRF